MTLRSLNQYSSFIDDRLKIKDWVQVLEKENPLLSQKKKEFQLLPLKLNNEHKGIKSTAIKDVNLDSEVNHLIYDLEAKD